MARRSFIRLKRKVVDVSSSRSKIKFKIGLTELFKVISRSNPLLVSIMIIDSANRGEKVKVACYTAIENVTNDMSHRCQNRHIFIIRHI